MIAPRPLRHRGVSALVGFGIALAVAWPRRARRVLVFFLGTLAWIASPRLRGLADGNLRRVFPAMDTAHRRVVLCQSTRWLAASALDALDVAYGTVRVDDVITVSPAAQSLLAPHPRGIVVATGHLGNWELLGAVLASMGHATSAVVRRSNNSAVAARMTELRRRLGWTEIDRGAHTALRCMRVLRSGGLVGLVCDQASAQANVTVDFLGTPALTPRGPAMLARRSGARLVTAWLRRDRPGHRVLEARAVDTTGDDAEVMAKVNDLLGAVIRGDPSEWVWFHERWAKRSGVRWRDV